MAEGKDFNEYFLENVKTAREETREFKNDINKRIDGLEKRIDRIEARIDKLEEKIDGSMKEIRELIASSQKDSRGSEQYNQIITSTIVSIVVVVLHIILNH